MKYEVIVPVYNGENVIEACLRSIVQQKEAVVGQDYNVLVIDDGSTDRTVEIASGFPVKIISLGENRGRIVARLTGARSSCAERILFVDSRVKIPGNLIASLPKFDLYPAAIGVIENKNDGKDTFYERILFLIRRKYYGAKNFPFQEKDLIITQENFKRAPKGTTLLLIDRELFIKLVPERTGKEVNDDTLLFHNLVFREGINLLHTPGLKMEYDPARKLGPLLKWLLERGIRFGDFYLTKGGYFCNFFRFLLGSAFLLVIALVCLPVHITLILIWMLLSCYLFLCVFLSETISDFFILLFGFPIIILPFGLGVLKFWVRSLFSECRSSDLER